jgi:hypothetical protein
VRNRPEMLCWIIIKKMNQRSATPEVHVSECRPGVGLKRATGDCSISENEDDEAQEHDNFVPAKLSLRNTAPVLSTAK